MPVMAVRGSVMTPSGFTNLVEVTVEGEPSWWPKAVVLHQRAPLSRETPGNQLFLWGIFHCQVMDYQRGSQSSVLEIMVDLVDLRLHQAGLLSTNPHCQEGPHSSQ